MTIELHVQPKHKARIAIVRLIIAGLVLCSDLAAADWSPDIEQSSSVSASNSKGFTVIPIHDIQGPGASSPIVGTTVTVRGIVTAQRFNNGFFVQEETSDYDADPNTSEAIFVFTGTAPPSVAAVGNLVQVAGTVSEFVPSNDPLSPPMTQLVGSTTLMIASGNPLPSAISLNSSFPDPAGAHDRLEAVEGMRVSINSIIVTAPSEGFITESSATSSSNGIFYGVLTGMGRALREPGIRAPDPAPSGTIPPIPRWDFNPELIRINTRGQVGATALAVDSLAQVINISGVLDFASRRYTVLTDTDSPPIIGGGASPSAVFGGNDSIVAVAFYSLQRFFDEVNDGNGGVTLTAAALDKRLTKNSLVICDYAKTPDIVALSDVENLRVLGLLADRINSTCARAPQYVPYLVQGNDSQGLNLGYLVSNRMVNVTIPRVEVLSVTQVGASALFVNPDTSSGLLFDRPPLWMHVRIHAHQGPITELMVLNVQLSAATGSSDVSAGSAGWATEGHRVRAKRLAQASFIANEVQNAQVSDLSRNVVVAGRFFAGPFNDGLVDVEGVIKGAPAPDAQTSIEGDGVDVVNPDLVNLWGSVSSMDRYNAFAESGAYAGGNAETSSHILLNQSARDLFAFHHLEIARINADFGVHAYTVPNQANRAADNDPIVAYLFSGPIFSDGFESNP